MPVREDTSYVMVVDIIARCAELHLLFLDADHPDCLQGARCRDMGRGVAMSHNMLGAFIIGIIIAGQEGEDLHWRRARELVDPGRCYAPSRIRVRGTVMLGHTCGYCGRSEYGTIVGVEQRKAWHEVRDKVACTGCTWYTRNLRLSRSSWLFGIRTAVETVSIGHENCFNGRDNQLALTHQFLPALSNSCVLHLCTRVLRYLQQLTMAISMYRVSNWLSGLAIHGNTAV